jgi:hypothetical protein
MSVVGIAGSSIFQHLINPSSSSQSNGQNFQTEFQQLGQDLSSGNLSQATADFQALGLNLSTTSTTSTSQSPLTTAMQQLAGDLQSGNLTGAQQAYSTVKQDLQQPSSAGAHHFHHHHSGSSQNSQQQNPIDQLFAQLGQDLQSGNLSSAQTAYSSLQQDFLQLSGSNPTTSTNSVNLSA